MTKLVCFNDKYALISSQMQTSLIQLSSFDIIGVLQGSSKIGSLQYSTGIAALVSQSKIRLYDFLYKKDLYDYQTHLKVMKIGLFKNLLIVISTQRILIHDLRKKVNQCYIPIQDGELAFMSRDYYSLRFAYHIEKHLLINRQLWLNKNENIQGVSFTLGCYSNNGQQIGLVLKNLFSIYQKSNLIRLYGFDYQIIQMVYAGNYFFLKLQNNQIYGCNKENKVIFDTFEEIEVDMWQGDSKLIGTTDVLYQICQQKVKKYMINKVLPHNIGDSKIIKPRQQKNMKKQ